MVIGVIRVLVEQIPRPLTRGIEYLGDDNLIIKVIAGWILLLELLFDFFVEKFHFFLLSIKNPFPDSTVTGINRIIGIVIRQS
jgi:hypothetical protein